MHELSRHCLAGAKTVADLEFIRANSEALVAHAKASNNQELLNLAEYCLKQSTDRIATMIAERMPQKPKIARRVADAITSAKRWEPSRVAA